MSLHNPSCFAAHMGILACEPQFVARTLAAVKTGLWRPEPKAGPYEDAPAAADLRYTVDGNGVAQLKIEGVLMKGDTKFGGTSTVRARRALRAMAADPAVGAVVLVVDSPGGYVAGTPDMADEVKRLAEAKPLYAYAEDMMASAAYWVSAAAREISAGRTAFVGSIGAFQVLVDESGAAQADGVKVHVVQSGPRKALGVPGAPVTEQNLADVQREIDGIAQHFFDAVATGRGLSGERLSAVTDGALWIAADAKARGLVDRVESLEEMVARIGPKAAARRAKNRTRAALDIEGAR